MRAGLIASVALLSALAPSAGEASQRTAAAPLRVLFVGNSLMTTNDLPAMVSALARAGGREVEVGKVTFDGFSLEDHWNHAAVRQALAARAWDVAIMQQGPSALPESQVNLREFASRLAEEARAAGVRPALLGFHPSRVGTFTAALVVYGRLFKAPLLAPVLRPTAMSARVARLAQASAARALGRRVPAARRCG